MRLIDRLSVFATASLIAGCLPAASPSAQTPKVTKGVPYTLNGAEVAAVQEGVKRDLKDPFSAVFSGMKGARDPSGLINVCGVVNSKNSYGGYVGETLFWGILFSDNGRYFFQMMTLGQSDVDAEVAGKMCIATGVID
jgi:hypothetical protein